MTAVAVSFLVMIVAVAISSGFRKAVRDGVSAITGDITIYPISGYDSVTVPVRLPSEEKILSIPGVRSLSPAVTRSGIVQSGDVIHGVLVKGVADGTVPALDSALTVSIPARLGEITGLGPGDMMTTYFVGEKVRVRRFRIAAVHQDMIRMDDRLVVLARMSDVQRLAGLPEGECSQVEVRLGVSDPAVMDMIASEVGGVLMLSGSEEENALMARSVVRSFPEIFDWLSLVDFNVLVILVLMTIVAAFNMISGLLIMLLRNIPTIGTLKTLGMTDRSIAEIFMRVASRVVLEGMLIGNGVAFLFVLIQDKTHLIPLDPANYFVSWVPVSLNVPYILLADIAAYLIILVLLAIPSLFIARVDPAKTVKAD